MPLPPTNETVMIYRPGPTDAWGCGFTNPYPPDGVVPIATVPALVKHHMKNGRFGKTGASIHWTHKMFIDVADIRDAYSSDMTTGSAPVSVGDLVLIADYPLPGRC